MVVEPEVCASLGFSLSIAHGMLAAHGAMPEGVTIQAPSMTPVAQAGAGHQV
jgi:hypothetical protein